MATVLPPRLRQGSTVAVVSPSSGQLGRYPDRAERAVANLARRGLRTVVMGNARATGDLVSASVEARVADLHQAFADPQVDAVLAAIGGRGAAQLLGSLDYALIRANPKVFCGYSDVTALHTAIRQETGLVTFYGPSLLMELGEYPDVLPETLRTFLDVVTDPGPVGQVEPFDTVVHGTSDWDMPTVRRREGAPPPRTLRPGLASGHLAGGCLPVLCELLGTPWQPRFDDAIVLLETPQAPYGVGQAMSNIVQLANAGLFEQAAGVVVGRPWSADDDDALADVLDAYLPGTFPVLAGMPFGHTSPVHTLPLGVEATLAEGRLTVTAGAVA